MGLVTLALLGILALLVQQPVGSPTVELAGTAVVAGANGNSPLHTNLPAPTIISPRRLALDKFKVLYDKPSTRLLIVDVRPRAEYLQEHIDRAVNIPLTEFDSRYQEIPKTALLVVYDQQAGEADAMQATQRLHDQYGYNFGSMRVLLGGWQAWQHADYARSAGAEPGHVGTPPSTSVPGQSTPPHVPSPTTSR